MAGSKYKAFATALSLSGFTAKKVSLTVNDQSVEDIETSHMGQSETGRTYKPTDLINNGKISGQAYFDPSETPPVGSVDASGVITWPDGATWTAEMYMQSASIGAERDGMLMLDFSITISGDITVG